MKIPQEIITDNILCRLPAKSLGRFKSVSKDWLAQIADPRFIKKHQNTYSLHRKTLIFQYNGLFYTLPFDYQENEEPPKKLRLELSQFVGAWIDFKASCNGLILASVIHNRNFQSSLVVINPTTRELVKLTNQDHRHTGFKAIFGFGYDSQTDDYKVVSISFCSVITNSIREFIVYVYSLRNSSWKRVMRYPYLRSNWRSLPGVFVNGFLHWLDHTNGPDQVQVIVGFSLADETFSEVPLPVARDVFSMISDCKLVVVDEKLAIYSVDEVWMMMEYGVRDSWSKISFHSLNEFQPTMDEPVILYKNGKIVLVSSNKYGTYDAEDKCLSTKSFRRITSNFKLRGVYGESLVSLKFS